MVSMLALLIGLQWVWAFLYNVGETLVYVVYPRLLYMFLLCFSRSFRWVVDIYSFLLGGI